MKQSKEGKVVTFRTRTPDELKASAKKRGMTQTQLIKAALAFYLSQAA